MLNESILPCDDFRIVTDDNVNTWGYYFETQNTKPLARKVYEMTPMNRIYRLALLYSCYTSPLNTISGNNILQKVCQLMGSPYRLHRVLHKVG